MKSRTRLQGKARQERARRAAIRVGLGTVLLAAGCGEPPPAPAPTQAAPPAAAAGITLVLGKISDDPATKIGQWQPLADYLAPRLRGVAAVKVKVAPDHQTMARWLAAEQVDFFFDNPYAVAYVRAHADVRYLAARVKAGEGSKRGVFFTTANSGLRSLSDLRGRLIAMEEPESASGFVLPMAHLLEAGLRPVEKPSREAPVAADEIGYVFSYDDENTLFWTLTGRTVAGAVDEHDFERFASANPGKMVVLAQTDAITRNQPGVAGPRVTDELLAELRNLLTALDDDAETAALLPDETEQFVEISAADEAAVERLGSIMRLLEP